MTSLHWLGLYLLLDGMAQMSANSELAWWDRDAIMHSAGILKAAIAAAFMLSL